MQENKTLQELITTFSFIKGVVEWLIQMLNPKTSGASSSHADEKDVETLCMDKNLTSSYEDQYVRNETSYGDDFAASSH